MHPLAKFLIVAFSVAALWAFLSLIYIAGEMAAYQQCSAWLRK